MSTTPTTTDLRFERAQAQVFVTDFERSLAFYRDSLGFEVVFTYGDPPFYGGFARDGAAFNLRHVDESPFLAGVRDTDQLLALAVTTTDAKGLFLAYQEAGVEFQERLTTKPWHAREFVVRDPDGNLLLFGSPVDSLASSPEEAPPTPA